MGQGLIGLVLKCTASRFPVFNRVACVFLSSWCWIGCIVCQVSGLVGWVVQTSFNDIKDGAEHWCSQQEPSSVQTELNASWEGYFASKEPKDEQDCQTNEAQANEVSEWSVHSWVLEEFWFLDAIEHETVESKDRKPEEVGNGVSEEEANTWVGTGQVGSGVDSHDDVDGDWWWEITEEQSDFIGAHGGFHVLRGFRKN